MHMHIKAYSQKQISTSFIMSGFIDTDDILWCEDKFAKLSKTAYNDAVQEATFKLNPAETLRRSTPNGGSARHEIGGKCGHRKL